MTRPKHLLLGALSLLAGCAAERTSVTAPSEPPSLSVAAAATGVCNYDPTEALLTGPGWTRVFNEDFSGTLSQWTVWYGGAYNEELQLYQAANLVTGGGILSIVARQENVTGPTLPTNPAPRSFGYTSGRIESRTHFSGSNQTPRVRFSARLKLPAGYGMWPAFWSYGDPWPTQGEIDIMEGRGTEPFQFSTAYWFGRKPGKNLVGDSGVIIPTSTSLTDCWHVYEVIWAKNTLTYLFDGQVVDTKSGDFIPGMFGKKQRITLNLAVGGLFFGNYDPALIQPGTFQVDWVKAFTSK